MRPEPQPTRLLPVLLQPADDGLQRCAIMLCEVQGTTIQSISLRVAADDLKDESGSQT